MSGSGENNKKKKLPQTFKFNAFNSLPEALLYPYQTFHVYISHCGSNKSKKKNEKKNRSNYIG